MWSWSVLYGLGSIFFSIFLLSLTGCGALFGGIRQTIRVESNPAGAKVTTKPSSSDVLAGEYTTPTSMSLERKSNYVVTFEKEGYSPARFEIHRNLRGVIVVLDVLFAGFGVIVDAVTGAWYKLAPDVITVSLTKIGLIEDTDRIEVAVELTKSHTQQGDILRITASEPGVRVRVRTTRP